MDTSLVHVEGTITRSTSKACNRFGNWQPRRLDRPAVDPLAEPP